LSLKSECHHLWHYRDFVIEAVIAEFRGRFARSILGGLWMILNPLAMVAIYTLVLSVILAAKLPGIDHAYAYPVYLVSGILAWTLFAELMTRMTQIFVEFSQVLRKMAVPKLAVFAIAFGVCYVNAFLLWIASVVLMWALDIPLTVWALFTPILMLVTAALASALGGLASLIHVFARDMGQVLPILLQLAFWMTPIVYTKEMIPPGFLWFVDYHPLAPLVQLFQDSIAYGVEPSWWAFLSYAGLALLLWVLFWRMLKRAEPELMDAL
jgi:lipopolysaccharide transport system permease protein